jgi:hypothetical protein
VFADKMVKKRNVCPCCVGGVCYRHNMTIPFKAPTGHEIGPALYVFIPYTPYWKFIPSGYYFISNYYILPSLFQYILSLISDKLTP